MSYLTLAPVHDVLPREKRVDSPTDIHRAVMALFGTLPDAARKSGAILFRVEHDPGSAPAFLIRSEVAPENLPPSAKIKSIDETEWLTIERPVAFRVAVNAVQRLAAGGTRPVAFDDSTDRQDLTITRWLSDKLNPALKDITVLRHDRSVLGVGRDGRPIRAQDHPVQVDLVDGVALVSDPRALASLLKGGVGRAKSYGCGLLTVKPLQ